jgi:SNF2 family DNA or RNA helicase
MMNNIGELHALIYFLRIPPYNDPEKFRRDIKGPLTSTSSYGNGKEKAMQAVQALLKVIMLRRTKKSEVDGKPIIEGLPDRTTEVAAATFDEHQAQFYHALETETQLRVNAYLQAGKVGKNYSYILVRLLRLRQACCHPHLIRDFAEDGAAPVDMSTDVMEELARQFEDKVVVRLKEADGAFECPICYDATPSPTLIFSCGHGVCGDCLTRLVDPSNLLADGNDGGPPTSRCPECRGVLDPKRVVSWKVFKSIHMPEELEAEAELAGAAEEPVEAGSDSDSDSSDEDSDIGEDDADEHGDLRDFVVDDDEEVVADDDDDEIDTKIKGDDEDTASEADEVAPRKRKLRSKHRVLEDDEDTASEAEEVDDADAEDDFAPVRDKGKKTVSKGKATPKSKAVVKGKSKASANGKGKGNARASSSRRKGKGNKKEKKSLADLKKNSLKNAREKKKYLKRLKKTWMPSAKTNRTMELLREIREQQNGERTIIFSQFTTFLDLLEVAIGDEFKYRRYDGSMRAAERNVAVEEFQDPTSGLEVLLVSLKAGNAGLNLTAANHVIILDPFWNPFVEEQAIDRAHRIGQTRPVKVHRVLVPETVEDRIIALQEKKRDLINAALDEKAGETLGRLGVAELRYLFGFSSSLPGGADRAGVIGDGVPGRAAYLGSAAAAM